MLAIFAFSPFHPMGFCKNRMMPLKELILLILKAHYKVLAKAEAIIFGGFWQLHLKINLITVSYYL